MKAPTLQRCSGHTTPLRSLLHRSNARSLAETGFNYSTSSSTVSVGTAYEHLCISSLRRLGFDLIHRGGRADRGIDLLGTWEPPLSPNSQAVKGQTDDTRPRPSIRVLVQCKAHSREPQPQWIRELEGAVAGAPAIWPDPKNAESGNEEVGMKGDGDVVGVLCALGSSTAGVREAVKRAKMGILWARVEVEKERFNNDGRLLNEPDGQPEEWGRVTQLMWNDYVDRLLGPGWQSGTVYTGFRSREGRPLHESALMKDGILSPYS